MKRKRFFNYIIVIFGLSIITLFPSKFASASEFKLISLTNDMIFVENGSSDVASYQGLIDEQEKIINDAYIPNSEWRRSKGDKPIDTEIYFDLKEVYEFNQIGFYDRNGASDVTFFVGSPGAWEALPKPDDGYKIWNFVKLPDNVTSRYVKLVVPKDSGEIIELKLSGKITGDKGIEHQPEINLVSLQKTNIINVIGLSSENNVAAVIDEQPAGNFFPIESPTTYFGLAEGAAWPKYQDTIDIDLKALHQLNYFTFYVGDKSGTVKLYSGGPSDWQLERAIDVAHENGWIRLRLDNLKTNYLRIEKNPVLGLYEVACFGKALENLPVDKPAVNLPEQPEMSKFMGMNGMFPTPISVLNATGSFREYHNLYYNADSKDNYLAYFPNYLGTNFDQLYADYQNQGLDTLVTLQRSTDSYGNVDNIPVEEGDNSENVEAYLEHAKLLFNFVARYGSTSVATSRLSLSSNATDTKTGLNLIKYFENWNEPDSKWNSKEKYFYAPEFAAMTSADYDGHEGKLGTNVGVKNADPNATFVMGGLAGINIDYIKAMNYWFQNNRVDQTFAADVINVHEYVGQHSPENTDFKKKLIELVDYVEREIPGKEIWLTEFGYDSYSGEYGQSKYSALNLQNQADWLIRSYLTASSTGINRAFMFQDVDPGVDNNQWAGGLFATSGLVRHGKFDYERKISYFYTYTMKNILNGYKFDSVIEENENIYIYKFSKNDSDSIYALWSPTENGSIIENYQFELPDVKASATEIKLQDLSTNGIQTSKNCNNGKIELKISETPIFVKLSNEQIPDEPCTNIAPGTYSEILNIQLSAKAGSQIFYALDGQTPDKNSQKYDCNIMLDKDTTIKAVSYHNGVYSSIAEFPYQINLSKLSVEQKEITYLQNDNKTEADFFKDIQAKALLNNWVVISDFKTVDFSSPNDYIVSVQAAHITNDGYISDTSAKIKVRVTVKPIIHQYEVSFESNRGSLIPSITVYSGEKIEAPEIPVKAGFIFDGWYQDDSLTVLWDFDNNAVLSDIKLYAKWKSIASNSTPILPKTGEKALKNELYVEIFMFIFILYLLKRNKYI